MKRFKLNWAIPGLFAMIFIIAAVAWMQTQSAMSSDPAKLATQCSSCHTMDTHTAQWQESSHKNVACTECHADPGVKGWVQMQVGLLRMNWRKDEVDLSKIATEVPNQRCLDCHARQMPWVMQDLKPAKLDEKGEPIRPAKNELQHLSAVAGHDVHLTGKDPLKCTDCHSAVSHGPGPEKKEEHVSTMHQVCLDCHAQKQIPLAVRDTVSCSACHLDTAKLAPADHKSTTAFRLSHGKTAEKDAASCTACHLNPGIAGQTAPASHGSVATQSAKASLMPAFPAGSLKLPGDAKDTCAACHGTTMPHPQNWLTQHSKGFKDKPELCASCHGTRDQGFNMTFKGDPRTLSTTDPSCTGCHAQPMPHPADYVTGGHKAAANANPKACEQCHSSANKANPNGKHATAQFCKDCHLSKFNHSSDYVWKHAGDLAVYGNNVAAAGCIQCHSTAPGGQNSCASCHTNGSVTNTVWHASDFTWTHKDTLAKYNNNQAAAGCTNCHGETKAQNACATCHTSGSVTNTQWHPAGYVATHKDTLAKYNNNQSAAGCTNCHGETKAQNACTACHTNGLTNGQPTQWHPANWWVKHAQTTKPQDKNSCNQCHSYVEPSCAKCHSGF